MTKWKGKHYGHCYDMQALFKVLRERTMDETIEHLEFPGIMSVITEIGTFSPLAPSSR